MKKHLVFIGGGHSHAIALKEWGMNPRPNVSITLISDRVHTPYSGMLPGYIAGFYRFEEAHIDLDRLTNFARAEFLADKAIALDLENNRVICANFPPVEFDVLSIDIGSTPAQESVPGATEYAIPAKPVPQLLERWNGILEKVRRSPQKPRRFAVVGGGAGGVELMLAVDACLRRLLDPADFQNLERHLFHRGNSLVSQTNQYTQKTLKNVLEKRGINLHLGETVTALKQQEIGRIQVSCDSGLRVECDEVFWVTHAAGADWISASGLATDAAGFIQVNEYLQSLNRDDIFAAGDVATMVKNPRPKAGVFAVRQGEPLYKNLVRRLEGKPLVPYKPQPRFLTLLSTGTGKAIAARGGLGVGPSRLLWWLKDWIDRRFVQQFNRLPESGDRG